MVLVAFNGFGGDVESPTGPFPFHNPVDLRWLEVFDSMYSGDPRPSDVPEMNFWRSMDIYSDHMVRRYEQCFLPLERIDSTGFMLGKHRYDLLPQDARMERRAVLMMARGGWVDTVYGSLELLTDDDARWFAKSSRSISRCSPREGRNLWWNSRGGPALRFWLPRCRRIGLCRNQPGTER